jgi:hypothetical protein
VHDPFPTRPTDLASTSLRDRLAGHESHLTPLVNARPGVGEPVPVGRLHADALAALVCGRALADRLMPMRRVTAAETLAHAASTVHVAAALGLEIEDVAARRRSRADGQQQHGDTPAAAYDEGHAHPDGPEASR